MPATFPSHAAPILPLKMWRPRWFDGVALVVGSAAPDLLYVLGTRTRLPETHSVVGLFWWCLPATVAVVAIVRWAAPVAAVHLPAGPAWLAPRDYGVLGTVRHPLWITATSAVVGAASHVFWDGFTHPPAGDRWGVAQLPAIQPGYEQNQNVSTLIGALAVLGMAVYIGRRRLLVAWHGPPPNRRPMPALFWPLAGAVWMLYPLTWPLLPERWVAHVQGVRALWAFGLGILVGVAGVKAAERAGWKRDGDGERRRTSRRAGLDG